MWPCFSGNNACWQVRFDADAAQMTSYKFMGPFNDPVVGTADERRMTGLWSDPMIGRPENHLTGIASLAWLRAVWLRGAPRLGWLHRVEAPPLGLRVNRTGL